MIGSLYRAGDSALHRASPGLKLALLPIAGTALFLVPSAWLSGAALAVVLLAYPLAGLKRSALLGQLRSILLVVAIVAVAQLWFGGVEVALLFALRLTALLLLAALVTLTTRTSDIVAVLDRALRPLEPLGVDPRKVSLAISLTFRFLPLVSGVVADIREAQAARGVERNVLRLAVPVVVRLLKTSDEIAEAIDARR